MLDDAGFTSLVQDDLRDRADPAMAATLRHPGVAQRWRTELVRLKGGIDAQFLERRDARDRRLAEADRAGRPLDRTRAIREHEEWRANATRYQKSIEARLSEASAIVKATAAQRPASVRDVEALFDRVRALEDRLEALEAATLGAGAAWRWPGPRRPNSGEGA